MAEQTKFKRGDVVVDPRRPEWGDGVVHDAITIINNGQAAQRLGIDFKHYGRATIVTSTSQLRPKEKPLPMRTIQSSTVTIPPTNGGWLGALTDQNNTDCLTDLPEAMTDPFRSEARRLEVTLDSFRFSTEAHSLIEWAAAQSGLDDPLSHYSRQELEQSFDRYTRNRDLHLLELVRALKRQNKTIVLEQILNKTKNSTARQALKKARRA